jgi:hypothetical protein
VTEAWDAVPGVVAFLGPVTELPTGDYVVRVDEGASQRKRP